MIAMIAERGNLDPTVAIGGELSDIGCNAKLGMGEYMVAELDESDGSFELFSPEIAVITNVDWDHVDHYPTYDSVMDAFERYARGRKSGSPLIVCADDAGVGKMISTGRLNGAVTYGWGMGWDWGAADIKHLEGGGVEYSAYRAGNPLGVVKLKVSGEHNVLNSLAALAASEMMGIPFDSARESLEIFKGAKRRLQFIGDADNILVYDDYGHHPREIAATMKAIASAFRRDIHLVFQPHRYTRTQALYRDFAGVLNGASRIYLLPIYSADETPIPGVSSFLIADELNSIGRNDAVVCGDFQEAASHVCSAAKPGDMILTIGAGSIEYLSGQILKCLRSRARSGDVKAVGG
jgi:UDP-N-acetylmuramate--alanine ligase